MPGNSLSKELREQLAELGEDAADLFRKYGGEIVPLLAKYGDAGLEIIQKYGDDGVALLQRYGDDGVELISKHGADAIDFVKRAEKLGINPTDLIDNPPLPGQSLEGWMLNIDDPNNPVNMPLKFNLSGSEITELRRESIQNPDSKLFSIGYGKDAQIPFGEMANRFSDYEMSYLSMPDSQWTQYAESGAYGDFWEVNSDAIEWGMEERKIFVLNVDYNLATNPANPLATSRFTYGELRLIEKPTNNYTMVTSGEYSFFVPNELLDQYKDFLPPELLTP
jgi:hypothetical protein